jgi:hypothetical protein
VVLPSCAVTRTVTVVVPTASDSGLLATPLVTATPLTVMPAPAWLVVAMTLSVLLLLATSAL